ncbi:MAG TPA: hypothetical protein VFY39_06750, partial [Gammaproteobacteria bacterium]|nr:hypothetical protein [Gammaproteobacteria bacterium]
ACRGPPPLLLRTKYSTESALRGETCEYRLACLEIVEHRIAEDVIDVFGGVVVDMTPFRGRRNEIDEPSGYGTDSGRSRMIWNNEKIAVVPPMPSASIKMTTAGRARRLTSCLNVWRIGRIPIEQASSTSNRPGTLPPDFGTMAVMKPS